MSRLYELKGKEDDVKPQASSQGETVKIISAASTWPQK